MGVATDEDTRPFSAAGMAGGPRLKSPDYSEFWEADHVPGVATRPAENPSPVRRSLFGGKAMVLIFGLFCVAMIVIAKRF